MKTEFKQTTFAIPHQLILRFFIFFIAAFTALDAFSSTNTTQVDITVRFVQLRPNADWETLDWYMSAAASNPGRIFTTNLTSAQVKTVLKRLDRREGADLINEGRITTLNGRQAEFHMVDGRQFITQSGKPARFQVIDVQTVPDNSAGTTNAGVSITSDPNTAPFGKIVVDLVPAVSDDLSTIQMLVTIPPVVAYNAGVTLNGGPVPLPHSRVRPIKLNCSVKDGQTLLLGGFSGKPYETLGPDLLIFVTPILIDSSGNPIHHGGQYYDDKVIP